MAHVAVIIFAFNRANSLSRLLDSYSGCPQGAGLPVFIYLDAARTEAERTATNEVLTVAKAFDHPAKTIVAREKNLGLRKSLRGGISEVLERYEAVIVLEDDLVLGEHALDYFLNGLDRYRDDARVASICGYSLIDDDASDNEGRRDLARFLPMTHPWGWATWRNRWQAHIAGLETPMEPALLRSKSFRQAMNLFGLRNWRQMLDFAEMGIVNSWWIYWHRDAVLRHQVSLFPGRSQVLNAGIDGTGTHASRWNVLRALRPARKLSGDRTLLPDEIVVDYPTIDRSKTSREARFDRAIGALGALRRTIKGMRKT